MRRSTCLAASLLVGLSTVVTAVSLAAPRITRLTPPSERFASGATDPLVSRFLPDQRFDLQATVVPDEGATIVAVTFRIDGRPVGRGVAEQVTSGLNKVLGDGTPTPAGTLVASVRGVRIVGADDLDRRPTRDPYHLMR